MMNPVAMSIITATFDDAKERARAVGVWGAVVGVSMGLGRGRRCADGHRGLARDLLDQRAHRCRRRRAHLPGRPGVQVADPAPPRPSGQVLVIVLLASLVGGLIEGPRLGWTSPAALGLFVLAAAALVVFVQVERRRAEPLVDVRFFRSIPFSSAVVTAVAAFGANGAFLFLNALYLQEVRGMTPFEAGLWTLPRRPSPPCSCRPLSGRPRRVGRHADPARPGRHRGRGSGGDPDDDRRPDADVGAGRGVRAVRVRVRHGERADHEHRGLGHAPRPVRVGRRRRLDEPADRGVPRWSHSPGP